jgi:hypothetical protein
LQDSQCTSSDANKLARVRKAGIRPPVVNTEADLIIPKSAWSTWKETGKPRKLRRGLTKDERDALVRRRNELQPWVVGFHESERDAVAFALSEMLMMFPGYSMQRGDEGAVAHVDLLMGKVADSPAWAIIKACEKIGTHGYTKTTGIGEYHTERHWPPSGPELFIVVEECTKMYRDQFDSATRLLEAEVGE